jgi:aromatic-L-amino-acid decarboxylase
VTPDEFRRHGHEIVDWIAAYLENIRDYPVLTPAPPGDLADRLPPSAPERGQPMEAILADFRELIPSHVTHWNHPRFLAYFANTASPAGILGEMLTAALNVNHMLWKTGPAATELEQVTLAWLREWIGLPEEFFGIIYDTASTSSLHALAAAREFADPEARRRGSRPGVVYCSEHAHSSIDKAAIVLGLGQANVRKIAVDGEYRMRPDRLDAAIAEDLARGRTPVCIVATAGTTGVTAIDPVAAVAGVARARGVWLHVDAAYAGPAAIAPEYRRVLDGAAEADSVVLNPHKWMFTPMDLSVLYTRRPEVLRAAFALTPEYLRTAGDPRAVNLMDYGFQLGRRFRSLKLWFVMREFGREGVAEAIRRHVALAQEFASWVEADPCFEVCAPHPLSLVCFRWKGTDEENARLLDRINASGAALLSHLVLDGRFALRLAIGNLGTSRDDLAAVWETIRRLAREL